MASLLFFHPTHLMKILFEIEDVFDVNGRWCVLVHGVPDVLRRDVKVGDPVLVVTPMDNEVLESIEAFEHVSRGRPMAHLPLGSNVYFLGAAGA